MQMLKRNYQEENILMTDKNMEGSFHKVSDFSKTERQKAHKFSARTASSLVQI